MSTVKSLRPFPFAALSPRPASAVPAAAPAVSRLRVLIASAEPATRSRVAGALDRLEPIDVAEAETVEEAATAIRAWRPAVLFLDVDLRGESAFEMLVALPPSDRPAAVFLTPDPRDAARAFEADAADCVVRPFTSERIGAAFARARVRRPEGNAGSAKRLEDWLLVKKEGRSIFVRVADIDWIESARNNVVLHVGPEKFVHHETTSGIEARLDPDRFLRIHRSAIVRIDRVREMTPWFNGDYRVTLKDGTHLTLSESYRGRLKRFRGPA